MNISDTAQDDLLNEVRAVEQNEEQPPVRLTANGFRINRGSDGVIYAMWSHKQHNYNAPISLNHINALADIMNFDDFGVTTFYVPGRIEFEDESGEIRITGFSRFEGSFSGKNEPKKPPQWIPEMYRQLEAYAKTQGYSGWLSDTQDRHGVLVHSWMQGHPLSTKLSPETYMTGVKAAMDKHYAPKPQEKSGKQTLDEHFPRDEPQEDKTVTEFPFEDTKTAPAPSIGDANAEPPSSNDWIDDESKRKIFFAEVGKIYDFHDVPKDKREKFTTDTAGSKLHRYVGTASDLIKRIKQGCEAQYPVEEKTSQNAPKTNEKDGAAMVTPKAPIESQTGRSSEPPVKVVDEIVESEIVEDKPMAMMTINPTGEIILDPVRALGAVKGRVALVNKLYTEILKDGVDYGLIPGAGDKKVLFKPGAEKMLATFDFYSIFKPTAQSVCDWKNGFFNYEYECIIYSRNTGRIEGSGIGSCNSMEGKYRWRYLYDSEAKALGLDLSTLKKKTFKGKGGSTYVKYGMENEEIFDQVNTLSKMAQKRALIAATLNATGASAVFTQDLEDFGVFDSEAV